LPRQEAIPLPDNTPMMQQYKRIKSQTGDCVLFFRLGDFYEMFGEDAVRVSKELDLTLTTRDRGVEDPAERVPMCGVPYHSSESYIARLIQKGYKVAICEQTEDPAAAKGLVRREVIRLITPGTVIENNMLDDAKNNYLAVAVIENKSLGLCFCDISTGELQAISFSGKNPGEKAVNEIERNTFVMPWARSDFEHELRTNKLSVYFVAKDCDSVVGYCGMWHVVNEGHITNIAVSEDYRGYGIGDMLITALEAEAHSRNMIGLTLEVRVGNKHAIRLYRKHGFEIEGLRKNYYADTKEDAVIMWKYFENYEEI